MDPNHNLHDLDYLHAHRFHVPQEDERDRNDKVSERLGTSLSE